MKPKYWNFNITEDERDKIFEHQNKACALCGNTVTKKDEVLKLAIDHDHSSGLIRGLLCFRCNTMLGSLTVEFVKKILEYLLNPPATQVLGAPRYGLSGRVGTKRQRQLYKKLLRQQNLSTK